MLLSKRLKELRISNGLTQRELGERVNVTKVSICCYENGTRTPTLDTLTKLGKVLDAYWCMIVLLKKKAKVKKLLIWLKKK